MKRSKMKNDVLAPILAAFKVDPHPRSPYMEAEYLLQTLEDLGMLPPLTECKLVDDPLRPGTLKHSEVKREWEKEDE